jgi:hypothetical protein
MSVTNWQDLAIFVGSYDISSTSKSWDLNATAAQHDSTGFGTAWTSMIGGTKTVDWSAGVMADFDEQRVDDLVGLSGSFNGSTVPLSTMPEGQTAGALGYSFNSRQFSYQPIEASPEGLAMAALSGKGDGSSPIRGTLMNASATAITASFDGTAYEIGAIPSGSKMYAALHVLGTPTGTSPTLDIEIESDDAEGMSSPTTRMVLDQATGATSQWLPLSGAITDDWWRITATVGGTTPSFRFAVILGIA